ncbi:MAG: HD domain-containing protein [Candidatus Moraniibacteriota bacterium]
MALNTIVELLRPNQIDRAYFFSCIRRSFPKHTPGHTLIEKAYRVAKEAHRKDVRRSGERYFEHPRAVALIMSEYLRLRDADAIAAGLTHDVPEDHPAEWPSERLADELNASTAGRVEWGNKRRFDSVQDEAVQKSRYQRSLLLDAPREAAEWKLPDGLHNLLTLWNTSPEVIQGKIDDALA